MAQNILEKSTTLEIKTVQGNIGSLHDISSSFLEVGTPQKTLKNLELEQIVNNSLDQIQSISHCSDINVNNIVDLVMAKVRCKLYCYDKLSRDTMHVKDSLKTYMQQMQAVDQDIADIYLDLHNIYRKLERCDDGTRRLSSTKRGKLSRRVQESEDLQKRSRHYLTNDAKKLCAMLDNPPQGPKPAQNTNLNL